MKFEITTLGKGWNDQDTILLHAAFQCLVNWVEKENGLTHANYKTYRKTINKCEELYKWWKENHDKYNVDNSKEYDDKLKQLIKIYHFLWT